MAEWHLGAARRRARDARKEMRSATSKSMLRDDPDHSLWLMSRVFENLKRAHRLLDEHDKEEDPDGE